MKKRLKRSINLIILYLALTAVLPLPYIPYNTFSITAEAAVTVSKPIASLDQGGYYGAQTLKLTCKTEGAVIYYTTNGSKPGKKSIKYTKPITIKKNCVIRAVAIKKNSISKEITRYYSIYSYADVVDVVERYHLAIKNDAISQLNEKDQKICNAVNSIVNQIITADMTDYDKIKAVHDYIINNCTYYDYEDIDAIPDSAFHIEGVILNGTAVCQGYAETFQLFMNLLNIQNLFITGTADNVSHAWNLVQINNNWYHVDTTWDDPISTNGEAVLRYDYFLIDDVQMAIDHVWSKDKYPSCVNTDLMYKIYENCIISSISDYEAKFTELYQKGNTVITILYPENQKPDMGFYPRVTGKNSYRYLELMKYGEYYLFTVYTN